MWMTAGTGRWQVMRLPASSISSSKRRAARFARKRCAIGPSQNLDLEDHAAILAALRLVAGTSATIGGQMLQALAIEHSPSLDSIQTARRSPTLYSARVG